MTEATNPNMTIITTHITRHLMQRLDEIQRVFYNSRSEAIRDFVYEYFDRHFDAIPPPIAKDLPQPTPKPDPVPEGIVQVPEGNEMGFRLYKLTPTKKYNIKGRT